MGENKKILFVANVAKEHINKFHIPTIREFKSRGWVVDVACSVDAEIPECDSLFNMCWKRSPFTLDTVKGISQLKKLLKANAYNVIYCHTPVGGLITRLAAGNARKHGTKVIYCAHGFHFFKGAPLINWLLYYPMERVLAHFCDTIFTVNEADYRCAKKKFTKNVEVVFVPEVGVSFDRLNINHPEEVRKKYRETLALDDQTTALIYVAELLPNKNQTMLVDTLKKLREQGENVKLILPGPDHNYGSLKKYIDSLELSNQVTLLGWRSDIGELLYACDICTASSIREGFGINLVEAMYCGLPVVATDNRGHQMIVKDGENGFLVRVNDADTMAERVSRLMHDKELRTKMSGLDVSQYDCKAVASRLFNEIVKRVK